MLCIVAVAWSATSFAQSFVAFGNNTMYAIELSWTLCGVQCDIAEIGPSANFDQGTSYCDDGNLYGMIGNDIYSIDPTSGDYAVVLSNASMLELTGMGCADDHVFYSIGYQDGGLYINDINTGTTTLVGLTGFLPDDELIAFEGEYYFNSNGSIIRIDLITPSNSEVVITYDISEIELAGLSGSSQCNTLIGINANTNELISIHLGDGMISPLCSLPENVSHLASVSEFDSPDCNVYIDLDCDDSSGAPGADFYIEYSCDSFDIPIADDILISYDDMIIEMAVDIISGNTNFPWEFINILHGIPTLTISWDGHSHYVITNNGNATVADFIEALNLIYYRNSGIPLIPGERIIEIKFTTASGAMSNTAIATINVLSGNSIPLYLGPDVTICQGESATFDAGIPNINYDWNNGQHTQTITVNTSGNYIVTVYDNVNCPNRDTVVLTVLPNIHVILNGPDIVCENEEAVFIINTSSLIPIDVTISSTTGSDIYFTDIILNHAFTVVISEETTFEIQTIVSSQEACVFLIDSVQDVSVYPVHTLNTEAAICDGDSIWLGFYWVQDAGVYENIFPDMNDCDSTVITTIGVLPVEELFVVDFTCDPLQAGETISYLNNPDGCDTILHTTFLYSEPDTTWLNDVTCVATDSGIVTSILVNQFGCDSILIVHYEYIPPPDSILLYSTSCDQTATGIFITVESDSQGCDSILVTTITFALSDTTYIHETSCDPDEWGITEELFANVQGCDSLVITTVEQVDGDTTYQYATSCNPANVGVFQYQYQDLQGCDSLVIATIAFAAHDSTFIIAASCHQADTGIVINQYINSIGCDSIVTTTTVLLPHHAVTITSQTCDPTEAGSFMYSFTNQFGCDSIVIDIIELLPSPVDTIVSVTCDSGAAGIFQEVFQNQSGCDSSVIRAIYFQQADTTHLESTTCYITDTGLFEIELINVFGCDSIILLSITYSLADTTIIEYSTCDSSQLGEFEAHFIASTGCDSVVFTSVSFAEHDLTFIIDQSCNPIDTGVFVSIYSNQVGCDSIITTTVTLVDADTTRLNFMTCFEDEVGVEETLFTSVDSCDSLVVSTTVLYPGTLVTLATLYDYNGYDISCDGGEDGGIVANVNGTPPYTYIWSTGSPDHQITGLAAGQYTVTVTDGNGCEFTSSFILQPASALASAFAISEPGCFDNALGSITAEVTGGAPPYSFSLDGINYQQSPSFENLQSGIYQVTIKDANDCEIKEIIAIHVPVTVTVELGDDQVISLGDSAEITAVVNLLFDSIASINWHSPDSIDCPNCLTQIVAPIITTAYAISVTSTDGCTDSDTMTVVVSTDHHFYIPNIFSPNGDGINDVVTVHTSDDVEAILAFSIFDRWGNLVFSKNESDPVIQWDGMFNGKRLNPGVFTYKAIVRYRDDKVERRYGDITLIR